MDFIDKNEFAEAANLKRYGLEFLAVPLMRLFQYNKVNELYKNSYDTNPLVFIDNLFKNLDVSIEVKEHELERLPSDGPFIIVANHPYGFIDGLIMIKLLLTRRPDSKVMANFMLEKIEPLKQSFFAVNPFEGEHVRANSFGGLRKTLQHLKDGHPLGLFPAGEVSTKYKGTKKIADRDWQISAVKIIKAAKVPVIPLFFAGTNSQLFHMLGRVHSSLRSARIPAEILNKKGHHISVRIGNPIKPEEIAEFDTDEKVGKFLRAKTYALGTEINIKRFFRPNLQALKKPQTIIDAVPRELQLAEIKKLARENLILEQGDFMVYIAHSSQIENVLQEIGRLREITFREVGEGSNESIDIDEYDLYYRHLFIWDKKQEQIAGAYRIGKGDEIMLEFGKKGFYTQSLFRYKDEFSPILKQTVELGRSFVAKAYQTKPLPLFLLWRGILHFLLQNAQFRYIIGPVTISNQYSDIAKWMIIEFIKRNYYNAELAEMVKPRTEFEVKKRDRDEKLLDALNFTDLGKLDKLISEIEPSESKVPVLLKKYLKQNAKIIAFNIDPKFNNALDGLMILDMNDLPQGTIDKLKLEMKEQSKNIG
ncbi:GNAT family N-acetyltransferase [bacterium]|nr:GNAT family N-acetyltransferase [bacterium]